MIAWEYLKYLLAARSPHLIHSPFVYEFCTKVLPHTPSQIGARIEARRKECLLDKRILQWQDLGAGFGGKASGVQRKTIAEIAKSSARRRKEGELLYRICQHYAFQKGIEFGTNLGISTCYQVAGLPASSTFVTLEGAPEIAAIAKENFKEIGVSPIQEIGEFSAVLPTLSLDTFRPDYVFLDGNHRYAPTMEYFHAVLPFMQDGGVVILDDIYWSEEMKRAWLEISAHIAVTVSIDVFTFGICFIRRPQVKEHFILRF
jgi:predicted O-methyltransferase YrrM